MKKGIIIHIALCLLLSMMICCILSACGSDTAPSSTKPTSKPSEQVPPDSNDANNTTNTGKNPPKEDPYKYVAVIGLDGAGTFFKNASTPNIDRIFANGAITYKCLTANPTISAQCWGSLLHGVTPEFHGLTNSIAESNAFSNTSKYPSFFRVIRQNDPEAALASFSHWNPINLGIIEEGIDVHKEGNMSDSDLTNAICSYLKNNSPKALFVQFDEADGAGHSSGYGGETQLQKIAELDSYIGRIYKEYENKGILDETLFIVTADHGGNGKSHGGLTDGEKYVMFAATGKTVKKGEISDIEIRDTASIVLYALGYSQPETWTGRVPSGLFNGVTASERPVYVDIDADRYHKNQPTPKKGSANYITNYIKNHTLLNYLPLDGEITDNCGGNITSNGKLYFVEGYFGQGVSLDDGYVSINNYAPAKDSFTASLWLKTGGMTSDPCIFSNKDWNSGANPGIALSFTENKKLRFNMGNGSNKAYADATLPYNFRTGWMHILVSVDRDNNKVSICYDFSILTETTIPQSVADATFSALSALNIGQDGTGNYSAALSGVIDEFMIFDGAFDLDDIANLANYYDAAPNTPNFRHSTSSSTPSKGNNGYITNFIKDKELWAYLDFDGTANDSTDNFTVTASGDVAYNDGFFGKGIDLSNSYASISDFYPATDSFSAAFWLKSSGVSSDPAVISNKNWAKGANNGFILSMTDAHTLKINFGDGTNRIDRDVMLPTNYQDGWIYVVFVFDRENGEIRLSLDFEEFIVVNLGQTLKNASADTEYNVLNIGQDGTGSYPSKLSATMDEFMLFSSALDQDDVNSLAKYFGIEK